MTRKRNMLPCPKCFGPARFVEKVKASRNKSRYVVVCDDPACDKSEIPPWIALSKTEQEAVEEWNGMTR